jgi:hypothetical protein
MTALYKIRRKKDGQFSVGGIYPTWAEHGVRWPSLFQLRAHIDEALRRDPKIYLDCEVVEIEEHVVRVVSPNEMLAVPKEVVSSETKRYEGGKKPVTGKDRKPWTRQNQ